MQMTGFTKLAVLMVALAFLTMSCTLLVGVATCQRIKTESMAIQKQVELLKTKGIEKKKGTFFNFTFGKKKK